ncbi:hypothetical protein D7Y11_15205 [Corallococcus sp. AB018]|uniref:hypothetical protein n=1 Tax=unclassified Corallococcus TaxID=2685029 RepID=UPI000EA050B5|nr:MULTISPECIES: hypothetical protein [unclassified Corallococcus]RKH25704.1 hypothetical protein D7V77_16885 [Corallococcus sp. CA041A]RUO92385.1 hypothetical protein D7Y11_15205 [Corallococcus sp. AB018]
MRALRPLFCCIAFVLSATPALAQYNQVAGENAPMESVRRVVTRNDGSQELRETVRPAARDGFGNAKGNQNDLAVDGAFEGQTVAVLQFYTQDFDFSLPKAALKEKGFSVYRWVNSAPDPKELRKALQKACQLWIISDETQHLTPEHVKVIKEFFDAGHGVYIWGDNSPYYADANVVGQALLGTVMVGNIIGDQTVGLRKDGEGPGLLRRHLLTTGLEYLYEGITIATIQPSEQLTPLLHGSAGNLVAAFHDKGGKRAIFDGGFTRLYNKWDTAGTARYVKNAAAWLTNVERFGNAVVRADLRNTQEQKPAPKQ